MAETGQYIRALVVTENIPLFQPPELDLETPIRAMGEHSPASIRQLYVPGGHGALICDELSDRANRALDPLAADVLAAAWVILSSLGRSKAPDSPVVIRGGRAGMQHVVPAIAEASQVHGVTLVNVLGGAALDPALQGFRYARGTAIDQAAFTAYCQSGIWPNRVSERPPKYPKNVVYALLYGQTGGLRIAPGLTTLDDVLTPEQLNHREQAKSLDLALLVSTATRAARDLAAYRSANLSKLAIPQ